MKDKTLEYYEQNALEFCENTINADMSKQYQMFLNYMPQGGTILDLGCGSGRDTKAFMALGYSVVAIDGSQSLCRLASAYTGQEVQCKSFDELNDIAAFDGIWACASLLHIKKRDMLGMLQRLSTALKKDGILYTSFKYGKTERAEQMRFYNDYTEKELDGLFCRESGLECIEWCVTADARADRQDKWLNAISRKRDTDKCNF